MKTSFSSFFTLLELLIVIAVIAILASLFLPALNSAREKVKQISCLGNLKQLNLGMNYYANDNNSWLPEYPSDSSAIDCWDTRIKEYVNYVKYYSNGNYTGSSSLFHCPSGKLVASNCANSASRGYAMNQYVAQNYKENGRLHTNYKHNSKVMILGEVWNPNNNYTEFTLLGTRTNREYMSYSQETYLAWRHKGEMNFIRKDSSGASSKMGFSTFGENIVWYVRENEQYYKNAVFCD
ncbi:MAG: hypothetical protein A2017_19655 [Lentisphaerae bacterium GWF2_44_16]|nr:MAG: hypothetical protein A2017_19655 [Lentisphaerae bacterium GWF2_44_16]